MGGTTVQQTTTTTTTVIQNTPMVPAMPVMPVMPVQPVMPTPPPQPRRYDPNDDRPIMGGGGKVKPLPYRPRSPPKHKGETDMARLENSKDPEPNIWCPYCEKYINTKINNESTVSQWILCIVLCIFFPGTCCYAFCCLGEYLHECEECASELCKVNEE